MSRSTFRLAKRPSVSSIVAGIVLATLAYFIAVPPKAEMMSGISVNSTADSVDLLPGDGICADALTRCTLRAAVMEANASAGAHTINLPAGTYTLSLGPYDNEFNFGEGATETSGDIDVQNNDLTIVGVGAASTIIDGGAIDRVFDVNNAFGSGIAVNFSLLDVTVRNGNAPETPEGYFTAGGAIQFDGTNFTGPNTTLTLTNCRIINSTAAGLGGGIFATSGSVSVTGSEISGNTTTNANGGGLVYDGPLSATTLTVSNSTIKNNSAPNSIFGSGGGLWVGGGTSKTIDHNVIANNQSGAKGGGVFNGNNSLTMNYNVIVGNTSSSDATTSGFRNNAGAANANNNWWGCNQGPASSTCDRASGPIGFGISAWLVLNHTATPNTIAVNTSAILQADFYLNNNGSAILPTDLVALNGRSVVFDNAVLGTISGADATISNGKANATYTAGNTSGTGSADATVDSAKVTAFITIASVPSVTVNPSDQTVCDGDTATFTAASSGTPPPTVQWQLSTDGGGSFNDIPGATSNVLMFTATASQNGYQYHAVFTNVAGSSTTNAATLTVLTAPTVTANPSNVLVCDGNTATFTASASGSTAVQWQVSVNGGGLFTNIPGAMSNSYSFTATSAQNGNQYRAVFSNSCGSTTTSAATLSVNSGPPVIILNGNTITLWPPNHQYHTVNVTDLVSGATDSCGNAISASSVTIASVTSDEVEDSATGADGSTLNDIVISCDRHSVKLRAERDGNLDGRVYTITFTVTDSHGHVGTATAKVTVPVNQNGIAAVDSGPHYVVANNTCP
jgi:hypothetical protein